jgi:aminopeptidase N
VTTLLAVFVLGVQQPGLDFVNQARAAAQAGSFAQLQQLFADPRSIEPLRHMVGAEASLRQIGIHDFPAPPGYERYGKTWVVFHRWQRHEHQHDIVFPIIETGDGPRFGGEIPEDLATNYQIQHLDVRADLFPEKPKADFTIAARIRRTADGPQTVLMRINDSYTIQRATYRGRDVPLFSHLSSSNVKLNDQPALVQAGSVLYLTNAGEGGELTLSYETDLAIPRQDGIRKDHALFLSYWWPHIGRQPSTSRITVSGPQDWLLMANGDLVEEKRDGDRKSVTWSNPVAVSYHHIVGGPYLLAAETKDRGRTIRAWHIGSVNRTRATQDVESAAKAIAFFEDRFGDFPYNHYDIVDTPEFYGLECYSFTVLSPTITSWATSHEVGHTWFGGIVPNTYIRSMWNESVTQYVDSILFKKNSDRTLEQGWNYRTAAVALGELVEPHGANGNVGYMRGAYVLNMLAQEIGEDAVIRGLRRLVTERRGKASEWSDVEQALQKEAPSDIRWFFRQWLWSVERPKLSFSRAETRPSDGTYLTSVRIVQTEVRSPFRLRFDIVLETPGKEERFPVVMSEMNETFSLRTDGKPSRAKVDCFGKSLAEPASPILVMGG